MTGGTANNLTLRYYDLAMFNNNQVYENSGLTNSTRNGQSIIRKGTVDATYKFALTSMQQNPSAGLGTTDDKYTHVGLTSVNWLDPFNLCGSYTSLSAGTLSYKITIWHYSPTPEIQIEAGSTGDTNYYYDPDYWQHFGIWMSAFLFLLAFFGWLYYYMIKYK